MKMPMLTLILVAALPLAAETSSPTGAETPELKALSEEDLTGLRTGAGMGLARVAELNGHPGPKHVLELSEKLELSTSQRAEVQKIFDAMQSEAILLGERIILAEKELDSLFAASSIDEKRLREITGRIAALQGELRFTHLKAHLTMKAVLSAHQNHSYAALRGIAAAESRPHHEH
jgi:Spy/CpxP family protein refolding chaperone